MSTPPPAPTPLSPPSQNDIHLSPASADPYSIPDTPYISAHSNRATDGEVSSHDPKAFDSEYEVRDLSQLQNNHPADSTKADNVPNDTQTTNHTDTIKKKLLSKRCIIITIIILILIATVIVIAIVFRSKHSPKTETDELSRIEQELSDLKQQYNNTKQDDESNPIMNTTLQNDTKRKLMAELPLNQSSSLPVKVSTTVFIIIVLFTIIFGMFTSFVFVHS